MKITNFKKGGRSWLLQVEYKDKKKTRLIENKEYKEMKRFILWHREHTYAEFEDDDNSHDSPDRVAAHVPEGFFEENQERNEGQSKSHLRGEDNVPWVRPANLPRLHCNALQTLPTLHHPIGETAIPIAAAAAATPRWLVLLHVGFGHGNPYLGIAVTLHGQQPLLLLRETVPE